MKIQSAYIWKYVYDINKEFYLLVGNSNNSSESSSKSNSSSFYNPSVNKNLLGSYLAGLIEGDGSIIVPRTIRNQRGKLRYPVVKITFVEKDLPLALKIKEVIGGGTLSYPKDSNYFNLLFQEVNTIQKLAVLLNGNMRTPKIEALYRLIDWLNARPNSNIKLPKLELDNSSLGSNAWLAGFIESDGNFYCGFEIGENSIAKRVKCYMRISQKRQYRLNTEIPENKNTNLDIMEKIREYLAVRNVTEIKRDKENYTELAYEVRTVKKESCNLLINYLTIYPLFSSKYQDFLGWKKAHEIRISKSYTSIEGTSKLILLKNSMNTKRTQFNWDSLNKFYSLM